MPSIHFLVFLVVANVYVQTDRIHPRLVLNVQHVQHNARPLYSNSTFRKPFTRIYSMTVTPMPNQVIFFFVFFTPSQSRLSSADC